MNIECIYKGAIALFQGQQAQCPQSSAIAIAVVAFILGAVAAFIICKLTCRCGKKKGGCCQRREKPAREMKFEKTHPAPADGSIEIYVGNLSYDLTEEALGNEFAKFGKVNSARIITNRFNGKSKGFGFVHMPVRAEAEAAVAALSEKEILGRKLRCNLAKNVAE